MDSQKRARLRKHGWRLGNAEDFLGLSTDEIALIEVRLALSDLVKATRQRANLTQTELAHRLESSQSRVAKLEAGDPSVSLDLIVRAAIVAGADRGQIARAIAPKAKRRRAV